ncbi:hypothetical protein PHYPO_G00025880 [Pangasianodon hypophthalmus]|uniref:Uncharacterized protein n=1 Tax=Pangasianodon hypophthalmus TaxID=310915 RepID=A0A5N5MVM6_PANHP|nr:hypothetical protein PHYPO_G00025880 [Pangasianodon hypophthalmus]
MMESNPLKWIMNAVQSHSRDGVFQICSPDPLQDENDNISDILLSVIAYRILLVPFYTEATSVPYSTQSNAHTQTCPLCPNPPHPLSSCVSLTHPDPGAWLWPENIEQERLSSSRPGSVESGGEFGPPRERPVGREMA